MKKTLIRTLCLALALSVLAAAAPAVAADPDPTPPMSLPVGGPPVKGLVDPMTIMILAQVAQVLIQVTGQVGSLVCTKYTSAKESCIKMGGELTNVMNLCAQDQKGAKSPQLKTALGKVRERFDELKKTYSQNAGKVRLCFAQVKDLGNAIRDFETKLEMTEAYCQ